MKTLSTITIMPGTKEEIASYIKNAKAEILSGDRDPLLILRQLKSIEKVIKTLLADKDINEIFVNEAEKYGKNFSLHGVGFEVVEAGVRYDFSECGMSELDDLEDTIRLKTEEKKRIEKELKAIPEGKTLINEETGETYYPPSRTSKTIVKTTLK